MLGRYRAHLEAELVKQELLLKFVINDKDKTIHRLEEEVKWLRARLDLALTPTQRIERPDFKAPSIEGGEGAWLTHLNKYMKEQEELERKAKEQANGVSGQSRTGIHEQASGDAQRPNGGVPTETRTAKAAS